MTSCVWEWEGSLTFIHFNIIWAKSSKHRASANGTNVESGLGGGSGWLKGYGEEQGSLLHL
jgi:hypothetical protein